MINIFIINLEKNKYNYIRTLNELAKCKYNNKYIHKYNGINEKNINLYKQNIHPFCKVLCTNKMIGIGLSHINLCKKLLKKKLKYALILEDDIKINYKMNLKKKLNKIIILIIFFIF